MLIQPIQNFYVKFINTKEENEKSLSYNAQYPNLQRLLNDKFDENLRRIRIKDNSEIIDELLIFPNEELKPIVIDDPNDDMVIIHSSTRWGYQPFTVLFPKEDEDYFEKIKNQIKRLLDTYKFLGTHYIIEYYE